MSRSSLSHGHPPLLPPRPPSDPPPPSPRRSPSFPRYDFVEAEDQSETSTISWGRWCGQRAPPSLNSKTNTLRVTLKSDDYFVAKPGFRAYYSLLVREPPRTEHTLSPVTTRRQKIPHACVRRCIDAVYTHAKAQDMSSSLCVVQQ